MAFLHCNHWQFINQLYKSLIINTVKILKLPKGTNFIGFQLSNKRRQNIIENLGIYSQYRTLLTGDNSFRIILTLDQRLDIENMFLVFDVSANCDIVHCGFCSLEFGGLIRLGGLFCFAF